MTYLFLSLHFFEFKFGLDLFLDKTQIQFHPQYYDRKKGLCIRFKQYKNQINFRLTFPNFT